MTSNDDLLELVVELVQAMLDRGLSPTLIGGLAVYARRHDPQADEDYRSPAVLASLARPTKDIDLAVPYSKGVEQQAALAFAALGLRPASSNSWSFVGGAAAVDLVPCLGRWSQDTSFLVERGRNARPLARERVTMEVIARGVSVAICDRSMLMLQKTIAWGDRRAARDLADIAALALADQVEKGDLTPQLERLVAALPVEHLQTLRTVADRFRDGDQAGPGAFYAAAADVLRLRLIRLSDDDEDVIRETVSVAVRQALRPWC